MRNTKALNATMGLLTQVHTDDEAKDVIGCILSMIHAEDTADDVIKKAFRFYNEADEARIEHIICNTVLGDNHMALVIGTKKHPVPKELDTDEGVFAYVYNADITYNSELGYIFLEKRNDGYHRIG